MFESLTTEEHGERKVVALLLGGVYWKTYFRQILPSNTFGVHVILQNTCGQSYTYQVDGGEATFIGHGDLHDTKYDYLRQMSHDFQNIYGSEYVDIDEETTAYRVEEGDCRYTLVTYPTQLFEDSHTTDKPFLYAFSLLCVFCFTSAFLVLYDYFVERRQKLVLKSAQQSGAIVRSLFPDDVRDRLYQEQDAERRRRAQKDKKNAAFTNFHFDPSRGGEGMRHVTNSDNSDSNEGQGYSNASPLSDAIAQLYPDCTVFFADIAGFTKWSSSRSPTDVFELLQTLYGAMDKIAKRRAVFKIETIGDCYLAGKYEENRPSYFNIPSHHIRSLV